MAACGCFRPRRQRLTVLQAAAAGDCAKLVAALAAAGVAPDAVAAALAARAEATGDTPLHAACRGGWTDAAALLLARGADVHARNTDGARASGARQREPSRRDEKSARSCTRRAAHARTLRTRRIRARP